MRGVARMFEAYHNERKPWGVKAVSLFVIFTFLVTQSDVKLGFAAMAPSAPVVAPSPDLNKSDKIHFMQDLDKQQHDLQGQTNQNPLNAVAPDQNQKNPFAGDVPQGQTPQISTSFLSSINPLRSGDTKVLVSENPKPDEKGIVSVEYADHTYFKYNNATSKIIEICDFTKSVLDPQTGTARYDLEIRRFDYGTDLGGSYVRITTSDPKDSGALSAYQKFSVEQDGQLGGFLGDGYLVNNESGENVEIPMTISKGDLVTTYDRSGGNAFYIKKTYQKISESLNRLLSYEKVQRDGNDTILDISYNDTKGTITVIDRSPSGGSALETVNFWEYKLAEGNQRGDLLAVGEMEGKLVDPKILSRADITASTYTFTSMKDPGQLTIIERLKNGGLGRILRYRVDGIDLEYVYEKDASGNETITVLNYTTNTFLKMGFLPGTAPSTSSGLIDSPQNIIEAGTFTMTGTNPQYKKLLTKVQGEWIVADPTDGRIFDVYAAFPSNDWGGLIRSRGPPLLGETTPVDYRYEYDTTNRRVYAFDLTHQTYSLYQLETQPVSYNLLEQGTFSLTSQGEIKNLKPTLTPSTYVYDAVQARTFDYAYDLLNQENVSAAVIVDDLTESDLKRLLSINKEVGVLVLYGRIVLFTTSNTEELYVSPAVAELIKGADFIAHTHLVKATGPSALDLEMAGTNAEYVITDESIYAYNQSGILSSEDPRAAFFKALLTAQMSSPSTPVEEARARESLSRFINAMDNYNALPAEARTLFRAGDLTPDEIKAFTLAETDLTRMTTLASSNFTREVITSPSVNLYQVSLMLLNNHYRYSVDINLNTAILTRITQQDGTIQNLNPDGSLASLVHPDGSREDYIYVSGSLNQRKSFSAANVPLTIETFNVAGRVIKFEDLVQGTVSNYVYNDATSTYTVTMIGQVQTWSYGANNQPFTGSDDWMKGLSFTRDGDQINQTYNQQGRLIQEANETKGTVVGYAYDDTAKIYTVTMTGQVQTWSYGANNQPFTGSDDWLKGLSFTRDGDQISQTYNQQGRLIQEANETKGTIVGYAYNDTAKTYGVTTGAQILTYSYGGDQKPLTNDDLLLSASGIDDNGKAYVQEFDPQGRVINTDSYEALGTTPETYERRLGVYVYAGNQVSIQTKKQSNGALLSTQVLDLGADGKVGGEGANKDILISYSSPGAAQEMYTGADSGKIHFLRGTDDSGKAYVQEFDLQGRVINTDTFEALGTTPETYERRLGVYTYTGNQVSIQTKKQSNNASPSVA